MRILVKSKRFVSLCIHINTLLSYGSRISIHRPLSLAIQAVPLLHRHAEICGMSPRLLVVHEDLIINADYHLVYCSLISQYLSSFSPVLLSFRCSLFCLSASFTTLKRIVIVTKLFCFHLSVSLTLHRHWSSLSFLSSSLKFPHHSRHTSFVSVSDTFSEVECEAYFSLCGNCHSIF